MSKLRVIIFIIFSGLWLNAQELHFNPVEISHFTGMLSKDSMISYLATLSSDEFEGREVGQEGNRKAAQFLAQRLQAFGFESPMNTQNYFQSFPLYKQNWRQLSMTIANRTYEANKDFYALPSDNPNLPKFSTEEILYLGYAKKNGKVDDFSEIDLANKMVMVQEGELSRISSSFSGSGLEEDKIKALSEAGVRVILVISEHFPTRLARYRPLLLSPSVTTNIPKAGRTNIIYISPGMATTLLSKYETEILNFREGKQSNGHRKVSPVRMKYAININMHKVTKYEYVPNVVGFLPGKDPNLQHEVLVISAHFDHLGIRGKDIFNGADDDGSGTSAVLEMARVLGALAKKELNFPARSLLILFANGEEKGLLGSAYYADNPLYPLSETIANLNVDMIGRRDEFHASNPYYTYIIGSDKLSSELHWINEEINKTTTNLSLDYKYNDPADPNRFYYRSDHYNFAKNNIPVIFYFTGVHEDYHRPTDTIEKIEFDKMLTITELILGTACDLLNRSRRPIVDQSKK